MTWISKDKRSLLERFCINVLKCGAVPRHVAIIMDGNRRYAKKQSKEPVAGHSDGFNKLTQVLNWCNDFGINEVTVYAFSIENFKRPEQEVNGLMQLAREKFTSLFEEREEFARRGICLRFFGDWSLLPTDIQRSMAKIMLMTRNNNKAFLNICIPYTSRQEMTEAVRQLMLGVEEELIQTSDMTESLLERCLYTADSTEPDLLIRASGEVRLSDFLLWQSSFSVLAFPTVLWPEFTIWHLFSAIFFYQRHHRTVVQAKNKYLVERRWSEEELVKRLFEDSEEIDFELFKNRREQRIRGLAVHVKKKRLELLEKMAEEDSENKEINTFLNENKLVN